MSKVFNSSETAKTINRAIDNNQGTTTVTQGAASAGLIINEDLTNVVECTGGYMNPFQLKEITGELPIYFHAVERPLTYYAIYGNEDSGDYVGDKTVNLFDGDLINGYFTDVSFRVIPSVDIFRSILIHLENGTYTFSFSHPVRMVREIVDDVYKENTDEDITKYTITVTNDNYDVGISFRDERANIPWDDSPIMLNSGDTALPFEPYGYYKIPITNANVTYTAYISDVLRKSSGEDPVYDVMYSDGTIIRNVDTDGTPLAEPTTETYTPVTVQCIWGYNEIDVDTTVSPSKMTIKYFDN